MTKVHVQKLPVVWETSGSLAAGASATSGSAHSDGYARIVGVIYSSTSSVAGSGLRVSQSADRGLNYDYHTDFSLTANSGSGFSIEIVGNRVKVDYKTDGAASAFRSFWQLRPI